MNHVALPERSGWSPANSVEVADARSDLFERCRLLMDDWAEHLDTRSGRGAVTMKWGLREAAVFFLDVGIDPQPSERFV